MSSVDSQVGKVGNIGILLLSGLLNGFSFLSGPNLRLEVPSYGFLRGLSLGGTLSKRFSKGIPEGFFFNSIAVVNVSVSGVLGGLISFPVSESFQGFSSSLFNPIAFIPDVVSEILKVFQGDIPLSGVLLSIGYFGGSEV